jgi:hypothetical protein
VHNKTDYTYEIEEDEIVAKDYIAWFQSDEVQKGRQELKEKQAEAAKTAPRL